MGMLGMTGPEMLDWMARKDFEAYMLDQEVKELREVVSELVSVLAMERTARADSAGQVNTIIDSADRLLSKLKIKN